jgi:hypothetical protein
MGWIGYFTSLDRASLAPIEFITYPRAAIKQAGGVASATRARAKMVTKKVEAYMLTEFEVGVSKRGERGWKSGRRRTVMLNELVV